MVKKCTSLTLAFSGLVMLVTSIVLYVGPASQVAHFCPWKFWGLTKPQWSVLHLNSGVLFCLAMLVHTYLNWSLLKAYIVRKKINVSGIPLLISLALTLYVCVGGFYKLPPMKQLLGIAKSCRMSSMQQYGSPPYGNAANYPVAHIAKYMGWNPKQAIAQLRENNIIPESPKQSLNSLAVANHTTIGHLLDIMQTGASSTTKE